MATISTSLAVTGYQFMITNSITSRKIDNSKFNYYIVAEIVANDEVFAPCPEGECGVNFCRIGYTLDPRPTAPGNEGVFKGTFKGVFED